MFLGWSGQIDNMIDKPANFVLIFQRTDAETRPEWGTFLQDVEHLGSCTKYVPILIWRVHRGDVVFHC